MLQKFIYRSSCDGMIIDCYVQTYVNFLFILIFNLYLSTCYISEYAGEIFDLSIVGVQPLASNSTGSILDTEEIAASKIKSLLLKLKFK